MKMARIEKVTAFAAFVASASRIFDLDWLQLALVEWSDSLALCSRRGV